MFRDILRFDAAEGLTKEQRRKALIRTLAVAIIGIIVVSSLSILVTIVVRQDNGQQRSQTTVDNTDYIKKGVALIISCNTPKGKCYKKAQDGRLSRTTEIEQVIIATGVCKRAELDKSFKQLETCVMKYVNP